MRMKTTTHLTSSLQPAAKLISVNSRKVVALGAACALALFGTGCKKHNTEAADVAALSAEIEKATGQQLVNSLNISQQQIVDKLRIETPFKDSGDPPMAGSPTLVAMNKQDVIEAVINGPKENLWSVAITIRTDGRSVDLRHESHRLVSEFLADLSPEAWPWVAAQVQQNAGAKDVRKARKSFGPRSLYLNMQPPKGERPATLGILIQPAL
jgi:hypothetical protein